MKFDSIFEIHQNFPTLPLQNSKTLVHLLSSSPPPQMSKIGKTYNFLSKHSDLLWSHRETLTLPKLRSQTKDDTPTLPPSTATYTYGEMTQSSFQKLLISISNHSAIIAESSFLDIGSGFGKPVFHCAQFFGCFCTGIEILPARVEFSRLAAKELAKLELKDSWEENLGAEGWEVKMDEKQRKKIVGASLMLQEIEEEEKEGDEDTEDGDEEECIVDRDEKDMWYDRVRFCLCDAGDLDRFEYFSVKEDRMKDFTHIYSYNKVMSEECLERICKVLNNTNFKVLVWYWGPKESEKFGLKNVKMVEKVKMNTTGKESFKAYIYLKIK